jgi:hypothetical protein
MNLNLNNENQDWKKGTGCPGAGEVLVEGGRGKEGD